MYECINVSVVNDDVRESNETATIIASPLFSRDEVVGGPFIIVLIDDGDGESSMAAVAVIEEPFKPNPHMTVSMYLHVTLN